MYDVLARTRDDAPGEAFDKIARACGLGYPGGPLIDKMSRGGNSNAFQFPKTKFPDGSLDFSFSGVKTAALNLINRFEMQSRKDGLEIGEVLDYRDFVASYQQAIVDVLAENTIEAAKRHDVSTVCIAGGVSANSALRTKMTALCEAENLRLYVPPLVLCTDNAAMIASAGYYSYIAGRTDGMDLNACPSLEI